MYVQLTDVEADVRLPDVQLKDVQFTEVQLYSEGHSHSYGETFPGLLSQQSGRQQDKSSTKAHSHVLSFLTSIVQLPEAPLCPSMQQNFSCDLMQRPSTDTWVNPSGQVAVELIVCQPGGGVQSVHSSPKKKLAHSIFVLLTIIPHSGAAWPIPACIRISAISAAKSFMVIKRQDKYFRILNILCGVLKLFRVRPGFIGYDLFI